MTDAGTMLIPSLSAGGDRVTVVEVGPRDGLQNAGRTLTVPERVALVESLADAGLTDIEVGSFVHPRWIPQMANTDEVVRRLERRDGVRYWALVPNMKGLENALEAGAREIAFFLSSSESHNRKNLNRTIAESVENVAEVAAVCAREGALMRGYISTVFGCPYEGEVDFDRVIELAEMMLELGADHVALGDTTGMGEPRDVEPKLARIIERLGADRLALHSHDTRGVGLVNSLLALRLGLRRFDASVGGMGGCPYARGAAGNLATEDLVHLLDGVGLRHDLDLPALVKVSARLEHHGIGISSTYYPYGRTLLDSDDAESGPSE